MNTNYYFFLVPGIYLLYKGIKYHNKINFNYFEDKNIVITGASKGIGKEVANILMEKKCKLHLLARSFDEKKEENVRYYKCDCSNINDIKNFVNSINTEEEKIDIVINCAGSGDWKFLTEMSDDEIMDSFKAPLFSSIFFFKYLLPKLKYNAHLTYVQSPVAYQPWSSCTIYSTNRWGLRGFIESLRADYDQKGIIISEVVLAKTNSNYFIANPNAEIRFPKIGKIFGNLTVNQAANEIIWAISKKKERHVYPLLLKTIIYIIRVFPRIIKNIVFRYDF